MRGLFKDMLDHTYEFSVEIFAMPARGVCSDGQKTNIFYISIKSIVNGTCSFQNIQSY